MSDFDDSLLGDLEDYDLENAQDDPFNLPDGVYHGHVTAFNKISGKREDGSEYSGLSVTLQPIDGLPYSHYLSFPNSSDAKKTVEIKKSKIKGFFVGCGVPASRLNTVKAEDVIGVAITFAKTTSKPNKEGKTFSNVTVMTRDENETEADMENLKSGKVDITDFDL